MSGKAHKKNQDTFISVALLLMCVGANNNQATRWTEKKKNKGILPAPRREGLLAINIKNRIYYSRTRYWTSFNSPAPQSIPSLYLLTPPHHHQMMMMILKWFIDKRIEVRRGNTIKSYAKMYLLMLPSCGQIYGRFVKVYACKSIIMSTPRRFQRVKGK